MHPVPNHAAAVLIRWPRTHGRSIPALLALQHGARLGLASGLLQHLPERACHHSDDSAGYDIATQRRTAPWRCTIATNAQQQAAR
eukprot:3614491-Rhodomonas_salina.1